jgi:heme exporter protein D
MANLRSRAEQGGPLSTTTIIAIVSAIGVVILGLLAALVLLLIRAVRRHKQLLADLDERGLTIAQAQYSGKATRCAQAKYHPSIQHQVRMGSIAIKRVDRASSTTQRTDHLRTRPLRATKADRPK